MTYLFSSSRLGFREWSEKDKHPFALINQDQQAMRFFPKALSLEESNSLYDRIMDHFRQFNFGLYAVDLLEDSQFIGFIGFQNTTFQSKFTPCIEIGWRLSPNHWNKGLATEGARKCLDYGFSELRFKEVYSFTSLLNKPSERIMQKIGLSKLDEFDHPLVSPDSPLFRHVLYHTVSNAI